MKHPRYAVFGKPVAHSLSPSIHAAFAAQRGLTIDYRAIEAGSGTLAAALDAFARDGGRGANVTLPLKQEALSLCTRLSERAQQAGAVNTLILADDGWHGDNTDGAGLVQDLSAGQGQELVDTDVLILGAGGAVRGILAPLLQAGVRRIAICNRSLDKASELASACAQLEAYPLTDADMLLSQRWDVLINALSSGHDGQFPLLPRPLPWPQSLAYDLSYAKAAQAFLDWARRCGLQRACDGLGMLVAQAAESFQLWHGWRPDSLAVLDAQRGRTGP